MGRTTGILCFFLLFTAEVNAQKAWTLSDCIAHAEANNISLQQVKLQVDQARYGYIQSWAALLPTINLNASQSFNFGLKFDLTSGILQNQKFESFSTGASSNFVIFNGLSNYYNISQNKASWEAEKLGFRQAVDDLFLNITDLFMQVMFAEDRMKIAEKQLEQLRAQEQRTQILYEAGSLVKGEYLSIRAQAASQDVQYITAQNAYNMARLALAQALMVNPETLVLSYPNLESMDVPDPAALPRPAALVAEVLPQRPGVQAAEFRKKASLYGLKAARGNYYPTIGLNASASSIYSGLRKQNPLDPNSLPIPFDQQLKENFGQQFSFTLSMPILNGLSTRTSVQNAKIGLARAELNVLEQEMQLRNTIERAYADAMAAYKTWQASLVNLEALDEARQYAEDKFSVQAINALQYNDALTKFYQARTEMLIAKYDYFFKSLILEFYRGNRYTF